ncbi:MAG: hypothetical protein RL618_2314 [Pseudomonadota bacterium]|jgi:hypothetical protein
MQPIKFWRSSALAMALLTVSAATLAADLAALRGKWSGIWYIGMSSGKAKLSLEDGNRARISFTNLTDEFGDADIEVTRLNFDGETLTFSVPSKGSPLFAVSLKNKREGKLLDGGGKFDGAVAKLVFDKDD